MHNGTPQRWIVVLLASLLIPTAAAAAQIAGTAESDETGVDSSRAADSDGTQGDAGNGSERPTRKEAYLFAAPSDESDEFQTETLIEGLNNPCGLLVREGATPAASHEIYFSESGAGRVLSFSTRAPQDTSEVVVGFRRSMYGSGPSFEIGPLGLAFVDELKRKLAVGTGGLDDGQEVVQVFELPVGDQPRQNGEVDHYVGPVGPTDGSPSGEGNFFGLARTIDSLFVTSNGEDSQGWVLKASTSGNSLSDLQRFIATSEATGVTGPVGIVVNPKPNYGYLVVTQMGASTKVRDSQLSFYSPRTGELALNLPLGLFDAVALAYSPAGYLYAADFAWGDPASGGIFRIDEVQVDGRQACQSVLVASIARPTSLAFTPDGRLYVTAFGVAEGEQQSEQPTGIILRITGDL